MSNDFYVYFVLDIWVNYFYSIFNLCDTNLHNYKVIFQIKENEKWKRKGNFGKLYYSFHSKSVIEP